MKHLAIIIAVCMCKFATAADFFTKEQWVDLWKHGGGGSWTSLARQDVRDDLKLTKKTCEKIDDMLRTFVKEQYKLCQVSDLEERTLQITKHKNDYFNKAKSLIGDEKFARLMQIHLQMLGNSAIGDPYWQKTLKVDAEQKSKLAEVDAKYNQQLSYLLFRWEEEKLANDEVEKELEHMEMMLSSDCARIFTSEQGKLLTESKGARFAMQKTPLWWRMVKR